LTSRFGKPIRSQTPFSCWNRGDLAPMPPFPWRCGAAFHRACHGETWPSERHGSLDNARRGRRTERIRRLRGRNKPLKGKTQGRYRREIEPERFREERSAKRLKKPEGAAQPGEASPVWVASRCFIRRRVSEPHEGCLLCSGSPWVILWSGAQVHERTE
jgi:hypothetical protein